MTPLRERGAYLCQREMVDKRERRGGTGEDFINEETHMHKQEKPSTSAKRWHQGVPCGCASSLRGMSRAQREGELRAQRGEVIGVIRGTEASGIVPYPWNPQSR